MSEKEQAANQSEAVSQAASSSQKLSRREQEALELARLGETGSVADNISKIAARRQAARRSFIGGGASGEWGDDKEATAPTKQEETAENPARVENSKTESPNPEQRATEIRKAASEPRKNPLFDYTDYTYGLSLHIIPVEKYNRLVNDPEFQYKNDDNTVLIASAGRRNEIDFQREKEFLEDFYFENLKITTVVGLNSRTRNSNAIQISFTLIEPYGFTLLNRILQTTKNINAPSWMQTPFMLQIDFFGNGELGQLMNPIPNQTKYLPVRIIEIRSKVTTKGAEYQVTAVPYSHQAYSDISGTTPLFIEVKAQTIADFFSATGSAGDVAFVSTARAKTKEELDRLKRERQYRLEGDGNSADVNEVDKQASEFTKNVSRIRYQVGSYAAALNSLQEQLVSDKDQAEPDTYSFVFNDKFKDSKITVPKKTESKRTDMEKPNADAIRRQLNLPVGVDTDTEIFSINPSTSIIDVINMVMRCSDYVRNQFTDPATGNPAAVAANKEINWYKIIPKVEIRNFDLQRETYSKHITYYVEPYTYYNTKFRDGPQAQPPTYVKKYEYIYTGKNDSILSFDIDFNTMFYTLVTAGRAKVQSTATQEQETQDSENDTTKEKNKKDRPKIQDRVTHPVVGMSDLVAPASPDNVAVLVNDFHKSTMSSSRGDMINVKLKIIGDPEFIKQDDLFFNPSTNPGQRSQEIIDPRTNSLIFDAAEIFTLLEFKTPRDVNQDTGLMSFDNVENSVFSGVYKVILVESVFERGAFTQTLDLIRHFEQDSPINGKDAGDVKSSENRAAEPSTLGEEKQLANLPSPPPLPKPPVVKVDTDAVVGASSRISARRQATRDQATAQLLSQQQEIRGALPEE